jgi:hypothetical protein
MYLDVANNFVKPWEARMSIRREIHLPECPHTQKSRKIKFARGVVKTQFRII